MNADEVAGSIVGGIINELRGRAGIGDALDGIDHETYKEMLDTLQIIVLKNLKDYTGL